MYATSGIGIFCMWQIREGTGMTKSDRAGRKKDRAAPQAGERDWICRGCRDYLVALLPKRATPHWSRVMQVDEPVHQAQLINHTQAWMNAAYPVHYLALASTIIGLETPEDTSDKNSPFPPDVQRSSRSILYSVFDKVLSYFLSGTMHILYFTVKHC